MFARLSPDNDVNGVRIKATSDMVQLGVAPYYRAVDWTYGTTASGKQLRLIVEPEAGFRFTICAPDLRQHEALNLAGGDRAHRAGVVSPAARPEADVVPV